MIVCDWCYIRRLIYYSPETLLLKILVDSGSVLITYLVMAWAYLGMGWAYLVMAWAYLGMGYCGTFHHLHIKLGSEKYVQYSL